MMTARTTPRLGKESKAGKGIRAAAARRLELAAARLGALAHGSRLVILRELAGAGPGGLSAGAIGARVSLAPATLSFHLAQLSRVGLTSARRQGRFVFYAADCQAMTEMLDFLGEHCSEPRVTDKRAGARSRVRSPGKRGAASA